MKKINKLNQKKYRKETGEFFVEGVKGVGEALKAGVEITSLLILESRKNEKNIKEILSRVNTKSVQIKFLSNREGEAIKTTETFPGIMASVKKNNCVLEDLLANKAPIVCLDRISDPGNLGTIIRTCDWFGVQNIILTSGSVDAYNEKCVRSTMGSIFRVNIYFSQDIVLDLKLLKTKKYQISALDLNGDNINNSNLGINDKSIFIFGSESHGVSADLKNIADKVYTIPGRGRAESLNVSIAAAIVLSKIKD